MYRFGLGRIKECGFFDMLLSAIECLTGGLTLDEALGTIVISALEGMGIENFGELFVGLPPDKQDEIERMVRQQLEEGEFFQSVGVLPKPWEAQEIIDKERDARIEGSYEGHTSVKKSQAYQPSAAFVHERSVMSSYDAGVGALNEIPPDNIMQAYLKAIVEVYSDNLLALVSKLSLIHI